MRLFLSVIIRCFDQTLLILYFSVIFAWSFGLWHSFSHLIFSCSVSSVVASLDFDKGQQSRCFGKGLIN
uniref:Uncharacterized protein n=1 Tax=Aegilops tauschii subsp. strangulata TaxID=200361 RepID=A0A453DP04_AEGTS